jgi:hypothetical protein
MEYMKHEIQDIMIWYGEDELDGNAAADASRRHSLVVQWYEWGDREYPGECDWKSKVSAAGPEVDIRVLIRMNSTAGYAILLFLEACYAVDKALCGTDIEALAEVKKWHMPQEMRAYKYLISEEMMLWWATELGELENEIKSPLSNRVSLSWRLDDLGNCLAKLEEILDCENGGIETAIWTTIGESCQPEPPPCMERAIYNRVDRLRSSIKILGKALKRSQQGGFASDTHISSAPSVGPMETFGQFVVWGRNYMEWQY